MIERRGKPEVLPLQDVLNIQLAGRLASASAKAVGIGPYFDRGGVRQGLFILYYAVVPRGPMDESK